jgi:magnesium-transporting ATPase (P-type)
LIVWFDMQDGVKNSDTQKSVVSLLVAGAMFVATFSEPLEQLAPERPRESIISVHMLVNVMGQFGVHLVAMMAIVVGHALPARDCCRCSF